MIGKAEMKKQSMYELTTHLASLYQLLEYATDVEERKQIRKKIQTLRSRIANRNKYQTMRDMGLTKTPYGWE